MELDSIGYGFFLHLSGGTGRIVIILGVDMSSSTKIDNRGKNIVILGKGPTQGLEHALSAERMHSINFIDNNKKFCLSLHYNQTSSYLFVNGIKIYKLNNSEIVATPLSLGNISKDWTVDNIKKIGLNGYVYDFGADFDAIAVDDILGIHTYLMKKNNLI